MSAGSVSEPLGRDALGGASDDDIAAGRQWLGSMKWIHAVEVLTMPAGSSAVVRGIGNRTPVRRRIPLSVARGLVALGVPLVRLPAPTDRFVD